MFRFEDFLSDGRRLLFCDDLRSIMLLHQQQRGQVGDIDGALRHVRSYAEVFVVNAYSQD